MSEARNGQDCLLNKLDRGISGVLPRGPAAGHRPDICITHFLKHVIYFDTATKLPHGNAKQIRELKELLKQSDIVTLHVPSDATTRNMTTAKRSF